jgi:hypothetical protein
VYKYALAPDAPTSVSTNTKGSNIEVTWATPIINGEAVTSYNIEYKTKNTAFASSELTELFIDTHKATIPMSALRAKPFLLIDGDQVVVKMTATNARGTSSISVEGEGAIMPTTVAAPTDLQESSE